MSNGTDWCNRCVDCAKRWNAPCLRECPHTRLLSDKDSNFKVIPNAPRTVPRGWAKHSFLQQKDHPVTQNTSNCKTMESQPKECTFCQTAPRQSPASGSNSYLKSKILVIDDQPVNVELLQAVLADNGYQDVQAIVDSRVALEVCGTFEPDLVLLDLMDAPRRRVCHSGVAGYSTLRGSCRSWC
jgi:hypothetical protein